MRIKIGLIFYLFIIIKSLSAQTEMAKTEVMVLGTFHLNQIKDFKNTMLDSTIAKLDSFKFDAICIENMPGELLYDIRSRNDSTFNDVLDSFGGKRLEYADEAQKNYGIGFLEAQAKTKELLQKSKFSDLDHKLLMHYFIASTDLASATLHYQYINNKSTFKKTAFEIRILEKTEQLIKSKNEIYSLALRLAYNRNLQKLEYIDNFQDESLLVKYYPMIWKEFMDNQELFKNIENLPIYKNMNKLVKQGTDSNDLLDLYLFTNSKEYQTQDFDAQWSIWLKTNFPSGSDRARYSLWEMRNLQITANIMQTVALYPGKRILVIIGASHKSFIEKYLQQIVNIELLKFE